MAVTHSYQVPDVMCGNCSSTIERVLKQADCLSGVRFGVDVVEKKLILVVENEAVSYLELGDLLNELLEPVGFVCIADGAPQINQSRYSVLAHRLMGGLGVAAGIALSLFSALIAPLSFISLVTVAAVSTPLIITLGAQSYQNAYNKLRKGLLTMDSLFALSTITIIIVSLAALFFPGLPMMFEAGLLIFGFRHIGLAIDSSLREIHGLSQRFQDSVPKMVLRVSDQVVETVPLSSIQKGDVLQLSVGDTLPVNGLFENVSGILLNDCIITGSDKPRESLPNEHLYAGTKIIYANSPLYFRASANAQQSHLARLDTKITRAKLERSSLETNTNKILQYFIPGVVCLATVTGFSVALFISVPLAIQCVVSILVSACPCTLGLITPLAIKIGMKKAADHGIVFNSAKKLEAADNIQCVVFDLNGTLTEGAPRVIKYHALPESKLTHEEFIAQMAHFEASSPHPVARAIRAVGERFTLANVSCAVKVKSMEHAGLALEWQDDSYVLGSEVMLLRQGITKQALAQLREKIPSKEGDSIVFCARAGELIGYIILHDQLRPNAKNMINKVIALGKTPYLCTGADEQTAWRYAHALGITPSHVRANCVSHASADSCLSKKNVIDELRLNGYRVAAIGDGANDAEMIAASDLGIAMESNNGDEHTRQEAAAVIHTNNLQPIVHAFVVAKQTVSNIKQNLMFSLLYNLLTALIMGGLLLAGIVINPAVGALMMIIQSSCILFNVSRFARQELLDTPAISELSTNSEVAKTYPTSYVSSMGLLLTARHLAHNVNANVASFGHSIGFTDTNRYVPHLRMELFNESCDIVSQSFNELK